MVEYRSRYCNHCCRAAARPGCQFCLSPHCTLAPAGRPGRTPAPGARDARHACAKLRRHWISVAGDSKWNLRRGFASASTTRPGQEPRSPQPRGGSPQHCDSAARVTGVRRLTHRAWPVCTAHGRGRFTSGSLGERRQSKVSAIACRRHPLSNRSGSRCQRRSTCTSEHFDDPTQIQRESCLLTDRGQRRRLCQRRRSHGIWHSWHAEARQKHLSGFPDSQQAGRGYARTDYGVTATSRDTYVLAKTVIELFKGALDLCPTIKTCRFVSLSWMITRLCLPASPVCSGRSLAWKSSAPHPVAKKPWRCFESKLPTCFCW